MFRTHVFVKLMHKGLKSKEHDKFSFNAKSDATLEDLIEGLHDEYGERFEVYLEKPKVRKLKRDAIVLINGANMVAHNGIETKLSPGDLIVFMIAAVGG